MNLTVNKPNGYPEPLKYASQGCRTQGQGKRISVTSQVRRVTALTGLIPVLTVSAKGKQTMKTAEFSS